MKYDEYDESFEKRIIRHTQLENRWRNLVKVTGANGFYTVPFAELMFSYSESERHYHNNEHIESCLKEFDCAKHLARMPNELEMAIFFHDAVYDTKAKDNEEKSAELAYDACIQLQLSHSFAEQVSGLILATKHNGIITSNDAGLIVDIDLSIFGKPANVFDDYETGIAKEYGWYIKDNEQSFRKIRAGILQGFLDRPSIYYTDFFRQKYEVLAIENLKRSIAKLREG